MSPVKFGAHLGQQNLKIEEIRALWRRFDSAGLDWISIWDHFYEAPPAGGTQPHFEAVALLGALAIETKRAQLGCLVFYPGYRNPALLAKAATTLDHLSGGRSTRAWARAGTVGGAGAGYGSRRRRWSAGRRAADRAPAARRAIEEALQGGRASCLPTAAAAADLVGRLGEKTLRLAARALTANYACLTAEFAPLRCWTAVGERDRIGRGDLSFLVVDASSGGRLRLRGVSPAAGGVVGRSDQDAGSSGERWRVHPAGVRGINVLRAPWIEALDAC
jgi:hypothetical protein